MEETVAYYNNNSDEFFNGTIAADMSDHYAKFESFLSTHATILDCGCGSGRDSKHFLEKGYQVTALDASEELCKRASALTGLNIKQMYFQDIEFLNEFDGIWACASLLHVAKDELPKVFCKLRNALKPSGIMYASFKYGDCEGERSGRFFTDLTEESLKEVLSGVPGLHIKETWVTGDVREGRSSERWLNTIIEAD